MIRPTVLTLGLLVLGLSAAQVALSEALPAENLLRNAGTEEERDGGPVGWQAGGPEAVWSSEAPLEGERCLRLGSGPDSRWTSDPVPCRVGETFLYSGWLRTTANPAPWSYETYLGLEFLDGDGQVLPRSAFVWRPVYRPSSGWFFFQSGFLTAPAGGSAVRLVLQDERSGQVTEADRLSLWRVTGPFPRLRGVMAWGDLMEAVLTTYRDQLPPVFTPSPRPPGSLHCRVVSSFPGNVFFTPAPAGGVRLRLADLWGHDASLSMDWSLRDWRGREVDGGQASQFSLPAHGISEVTLGLRPLPLRGAYLLSYRVREGEEEIAAGTGRLAWLPELRRKEGLVTESPWGMCFGTHPLAYYPPREQALTRMAQLAGVRWCTVTPFLQNPLHDPETRDEMGAPGVYEEILDLYLSHGVAVRGYLPSYYRKDRPLTDADLGPFAEWVAYVVNRLRGRVQFWYYGGEPQQAWVGAWGPTAATPQQFFDQMKVAGRVIRELDPEVPFATPTFAHYGGAEALRWAYERHGMSGQDYDVLQYNPYESAEGHGHDYLQIMRERGEPEKPLVIGEIGLWAERNPASELMQAEYLVRKQLHILAQLPQIRQINWFCFPSSHHDQMGLIDFEESTPRPAWVAYAVMTDLLGEVPRLAEKEEIGGAVCYRWDTPRGPLWTVWSQGHPGTARLEVTGAAPLATDLMGNETPLRLRRGLLQLELTSRPLYLTGPSGIRLISYQVSPEWRAPAPPTARLGDRAPAPLQRDRVTTVPGPFGPALHFGQDGATVVYPVNDDLLWWKQGTLELWFRPDRPLTQYHNRYLLLVRPVQDTPYTVGPGGEIIGGSTYLHFWVDGGFISAGMGSSIDRFVMFPRQREWQPGTWRQVVLTWTEEEARLYLDGELAKTERITPLQPFGNCRLSVGSFQPPQEALEGAIGGLRTYSRVKPPAEIAADYRSGLQGQKPSPEGLLWEMSAPDQDA